MCMYLRTLQICVRDLSWNCNNYLISLKEEGLNWRSIFWKLWGIVNDLHCSECGQFFQCGALNSCPYHPQPATASAAGSTYYLCCQQPYNTFSTLAISQVTVLILTVCVLTHPALYRLGAN